MKIEITVFKPSGKWYSSCVVEREDNIYFFAQEFKRLIRDNNPADIGCGYIVVNDLEDGEGFHKFLYKYEDIYD